jgi:pSer/pThr/pTyr-binding forkhead associated (FHA) protein
LAGSLEIWELSGRRLISLDVERLTIGKDASNDVALVDDPNVSRLHAVLERFPAGWSIRDLGSRNGTHVNGQRLMSAATLRAGDEIRLGQVRVVFRGEAPRAGEETASIAAAPSLTPRERDVLIELCRPLLSGDLFCDPATPRRIAETLVVSEDAVKKHLARLYDKFSVFEGDERRRVRLANAAVTRGAVSLADLRG